AQIVRIGCTVGPLRDEVELTGVTERQEPGRSHGPDVDRANVPRDVAERVEREQLLGSAIGPPVMTEGVATGDVEDERALAPIRRPQPNPARHAVAGALVCLVAGVGVRSKTAQLDDLKARAQLDRLGCQQLVDVRATIVVDRSHALAWEQEAYPSEWRLAVPFRARVAARCASRRRRLSLRASSSVGRRRRTAFGFGRMLRRDL